MFYALGSVIHRANLMMYQSGRVFKHTPPALPWDD